MNPDPTSQPPSQALASALDKEIPDERIAKALGDALTATQTTRSGTVEPDHKTRLQAATLALAYKVGRPIERQQVLTAKIGDTDADFIERLAHSPALRAALRDAVEAAENRTLTGNQTVV